MQTMDESHIEAQQMSQDEEDHESESVRSDATTEENDDDEGIEYKSTNFQIHTISFCQNFEFFSIDNNIQKYL